MKLASLNDGTTDGQLVVVTRDLQNYAPASGIAQSLQAALDNWHQISPQLEVLAGELEKGDFGQEFNPAKVYSPLPRAYQWADGSAYLNHVELVRKARNAKVPDSFFVDPLMYQGGSDSFYTPYGPIELLEESWGIDLEAEVAVIVDKVPMGVTPEEAPDYIRLIMLVNDVSLRNLIPAELGKGFGFFQSKPATAFSPVAVTPDEIVSWSGGTIHLPLSVDINKQPFGRANVGADMTFNFFQLIAHAAKTRELAAGSIIGSGTISNKLDGGPGKPISEGGVGYSCISEVRTVESINEGKPRTPFLQFGDTVEIWMNDMEGQSIFGSIKQTVKKYER